MTYMFSESSSRVGVQVGDYAIVRFIGAGGMGEVYEVCHTGLGTRHAMKFLRRELLNRTDLYARFEREARIAGTLENRHIVKVRDFRLTDDGTPYMVMDLAEGRSLASILAERTRLSVPRAINLIHQACAGLSVAHAANIVHRDLKPDNLFVCPQRDGTELLKILDFGIAKYLGPGESGPTTETGSNLGTAHYMSPEQAQGARHAIDYRTDIYALGVIFYEMLSGKRPHEGHSYNEILIRIVTQRPIPLDTFCPALPRELANIVHRAMARIPSDRFQAALDFSQALDVLRTERIESSDFGLSLQPAAQPRSPELDTLASGANGLLTLDAPGPRSSKGAKPTNRRESTSPGQQRSRWFTLGLQFCYAVVVAAGATAAGLWLLGGRTKKSQVSLIDHRAPHAVTMPVPRAAGITVASSRGAPAAPVIAADEYRVSSKPSSRTSTPGQVVGQPGTIRQKAREVAEQSHEEATHPEHASGSKPPTIDDPLPPSPHAPGVSPVME